MTTTNLVVGILVLGLIIYRQLRTRPVRGDFRVPLILGVIGVIELVDYLKGHHTSSSTLAVGLLGSLVLAALFGAARALTTRVWVRDGGGWQRGNVLTAALWVAGLAVHLGYDTLIFKHSALGAVTIMLYLAVTFAVQRVILQARLQRMPLGSAPMSQRDHESAY